MMARRARHTSLGALAPRPYLRHPKPRTFWQKEWARHSGQFPAQSSIHLSEENRRRGVQHIEGVRARQMQDMERLLSEEREKEIDRQARDLAEQDPVRKRRLFMLAMTDRQKSRERILRVAREHELALARRSCVRLQDERNLADRPSESSNPQAIPITLLTYHKSKNGKTCNLLQQKLRQITSNQHSHWRSLSGRLQPDSTYKQSSKVARSNCGAPP